MQKAAEAFVERLLPADKARIGSFSNRVEVDPRTFTSSKDELLQILQTELQDSGPTPLWNAVGVGMTALLHVEGRRVVLVFTDGMDNPMNGSGNNLTLKAVTKRSDEEDVMVYAIGLASSWASIPAAPAVAAGGLRRLWRLWRRPGWPARRRHRSIPIPGSGPPPRAAAATSS